MTGPVLSQRALNRTLLSVDVMLAGVQQMHEMRIVRERTKADRLADQMHEARNLEDREEADNAVYDLIDQHVAYGKDRSR